MDNTETWKAIPGWPGYEVSDLGRVRATASAPRVRKIGIRTANTRPYPGVALFTPNREPSPRFLKVHQLVALAFIGPVPDGMEVDHINGDKTDAQLSNLEYVTREENMRRAWRRLAVSR